MKTRIFIFSLIFLSGLYTFSQTPKRHWKNGQLFIEQKKYQEAIDEFNRALELDSTYYKAIESRAPLYEKLGMLEEAGQDYITLCKEYKNDEQIFFNAGRVQYLLKNYKKAYELLSRATDLDKKFLAAFQYKYVSLIELRRFQEALFQCEKAIEIDEENSDNHYYHGLISDSLGNYQRAEYDYTKAIKLKKNYEKAYIGLAKVKVKLDKKREGIEVCNKVLEINDKSIPGYYTRAEIYHELLEYPSAINDLSKIILFKPDSVEIYIKRGIYYLEFNQQQNAINDFTKAVFNEPKNILAYFNMAKAYEDVLNYEMAVENYEKILPIAENDSSAQDIIAIAKSKIFELNKESNKPVIEIIEPQTVNSLIVKIPGNKPEVTLKGIVKDESDIESLKINTVSVNFIKGEEGFEFTSLVNIEGKDKFTIMATDIYNNIQTSIFVIDRNEIDPPEIAILAPYASENKEIFLDNDNPSLYIEGKITDESLIKSIIIDGTLASFTMDEYNPTFSATINIINKDRISVTAIDENDNENVTEFMFNREGAALSENNPMGKTWAIFIENSAYESFASLEGPTKDVRMMKTALASYKIHNVIHRKDMDKSEMERFFSIELRDLVRSNRVNSLLIWYAGHGKFINETGYWIPIDATRDDEFSYFNINSLKASLQAYSKYVTHTLIITDACESGPTFYQAMRSELKEERDCNDWTTTRFRSSQVFSSAGYELAVDNSQFTKTFANLLENNPDACIPIEKIVVKVKNAVRNNNQQEPKFGKIAGLEDEDGTFFFISK